jgi:hypothetical protein
MFSQNDFREDLNKVTMRRAAVHPVVGAGSTDRRLTFVGRSATSSTPTAKAAAVTHGKRPSGAKPV